MEYTQFSVTAENDFSIIHVSDSELQVDITRSKEGYLVEDRCTGEVLARNASQREAYQAATQYRQNHR